ncbi:MAG: glycine cleavage system aminomethyltransferase GcvT [Aphanocapsa feldmannii 277cV]|uniref:Aminomethyltransferase n=3 Tax=Aphanocapsa feldmannii TaxID=192050 RepID=A0A524RN54_9CHRO|nr:MAG: glycine cleavage system aminomethyltransferase GcvT [Aphanocapsa feldmannii 288cV]TGG92157.1 MAG: glycine cleavage system aminomethyltransferase GcvT [Aphanocapsa feldmannii 277cV]
MAAAAGNSPSLRRTPLFEAAVAAGGRMVPFAGWEMALQFSGLVEEHLAVRQRLGLFDISHMGVLSLQGCGAKEALQGLVPSDLDRIGPGEALYTVLLNAAGGIRDDLIVYDLGVVGADDELVLVLNAANTAAGTAWLRQQLEPCGCRISDRKGDGVLLALQGPAAIPLLETLAGSDLAGLPRFGHRQLILAGGPAFVARTGYTGEDGAELLLSREQGLRLWQQLLAEGVQPCGLGARDTLRLEAALHLHGQDMDSSRSPLEASLGWLVHLEMPHPFVGRAALEAQTSQGVQQKLVGIRLEGRAIARHGHPVLKDGVVVGQVTSGSWSPTLAEAIGLAYVPTALARPGTTLAVQIRGKALPARVVRRPFYRRNA